MTALAGFAFLGEAVLAVAGEAVLAG